jgi:hypothetical protein
MACATAGMTDPSAMPIRSLPLHARITKRVSTGDASRSSCWMSPPFLSCDVDPLMLATSVRVLKTLDTVCGGLGLVTTNLRVVVGVSV